MSEYVDVYGQYPNEFGTWYFRLQKEGVRYNLRQPPLFMLMNLKNLEKLLHQEHLKM